MENFKNNCVEWRYEKGGEAKLKWVAKEFYL